MTTWTEPTLYALLRQKLTKPGNGGAGEYALLPQVRNGAGFDADRTFDAVAVSLWPSRGLEIHCYEIKVSRSDWLRELKDPAKAEAAAECCDRFSVVVPAGIVRDAELPTTWGLLEATAKPGKEPTLRTVTAAPLLPGADPKRPIPRGLLVPMLRSVAAGAGSLGRELDSARSAGYTQGVKTAEARAQAIRSADAELCGKLRETVSTLEAAAGVKINGWSRGRDAERVGAALRKVLAADDAEGEADRRLATLRERLTEILESLPASPSGDERSMIV